MNKFASTSIGLAAISLALLPRIAFAEPAIVYDLGTKFDHSFNEAVYNGAKRWMADTKATVAEIEVTNETQREQAIRFQAESGRDPVIAVGFAAEDAVTQVADEFPNTHFVILDDEIDKPNIQSVVFRAEEGSFLVGVLAGMKTKSNTIGFIGGMDIPLIKAYECGYRQGAAYANPSVKFLSNMTGTTPEAWNDPAKGGELAKSQFERGADIVYAAAGGTGVGVLQAAADAKKLSIGVDSNQNYLHPGSVLTSMVNRLDVATYNTLEAARKGTWKAGTVVMGLAENGVDWAFDDNNKSLITSDMKEKVDDARQQIISGKIKVVDYVQTSSCPN